MKNMKKRLLVTGFILAVAGILGVGYYFDEKQFYNNLDRELTKLKNDGEIVTYSINSQSKDVVDKREYEINIKHQFKNKDKYPSKVIIIRNPMIYDNSKLDFSLKEKK
jgi:hypothetical protein